MDNIAFGLWIAVMGMGVVFLLLVLLMLLLHGIGWLDQRGKRTPSTPNQAAAEAASGEQLDEPEPAPGELTPELIAAISIAVITHARVRRGQAAPAMRQVQPGSQLFASRWVSIGRSYQNQPWKAR